MELEFESRNLPDHTKKTKKGQTVNGNQTRAQRPAAASNSLSDPVHRFFPGFTAASSEFISFLI